MDATTFTVPGQPVPQPRPRISTWGGKGRAYTPTGHPITAYRQAIALAARVAWAGRPPTAGPVALEVLAVFGRPPSHLNKAGEPRASAPVWPPKCDWDNLGKGVSDAITDSGAIWIDDDQVVDGRVRKRYALAGEEPRTVITVREVPYITFREVPSAT